MTRIISISLCLLLAVFLPAVYGAQQSTKVPRIGFLSPRSGPSENENAFKQGLRQLGYIEGSNIDIEWRFANRQANLFPEFARELARLKVDVIVVGGNTAASAAKKITSIIPIVFATSNDPVASGLVASLGRVGGNVTGLSVDAPGVNGKRLELLKECLPHLMRVSVLYYRAVPGWSLSMTEIEHSARLLKIQAQPVSVSLEDFTDLENAFSSMRRDRAEAFVKLPAAELPSYRGRIIDLAAKYRLPAIYDDKQFTETGGLLSYGTNISDLYQRSAIYIDKILKGAKPADLPVEQPTKFELVINLKTAKQIGLTIPANVLARADRVIK